VTGVLRAPFGSFLALIGPWLIWLGFAHFVRPHWFGDLAGITAATLSIFVGLYGLWLCFPPPPNDKSVWQLILFIIYAVGIVIAQPIIGLVSVCTTGDCI